MGEKAFSIFQKKDKQDWNQHTPTRGPSVSSAELDRGSVSGRVPSCRCSLCARESKDTGEGRALRGDPMPGA